MLEAVRKLGGSVSCRHHHHINYQKRQVISHNSLVIDYLLIPTSVQYQDYNFVTWTSLISLKLELISALHKSRRTINVEKIRNEGFGVFAVLMWI